MKSFPDKTYSGFVLHGILKTIIVWDIATWYIVTDNDNVNFTPQVGLILQVLNFLRN